MKQALKLCLLVAVLVVPLVLVGCGGQERSTATTVDKAPNPYAGSYFGQAKKGTAFELGISARVTATSAYVAIVGPNMSGIYSTTGSTNALGAIAFAVTCSNDGHPVLYNFSGTLKKTLGVLSGSGTWSSPTRGSGTWSINALTNVANVGSWTLTQTGSANRTFAWDSAYAALVVPAGGKTMLAILFDKACTLPPIDACVTVENPQNAVLGTGYNLNDVVMRYLWSGGEHYYARETALNQVNFSLKQLSANGKLSGRLTTTLVRFGSQPNDPGWRMKNQPFANVVVARDWRP